jgi:hypothetical protein
VDILLRIIADYSEDFKILGTSLLSHLARDGKVI